MRKETYTEPLIHNSYEDMINFEQNKKTEITFALNNDDEAKINGWGDEDWVSAYFDDMKDNHQFGGPHGCNNYADWQNLNISLQEFSMPFGTMELYNSSGFIIKKMNEITTENYIYPIRMIGSGMALQGFIKNMTVFLSDRIVHDCRSGQCKILIHELWEGHGQNTMQYYDFFKKLLDVYDIPKSSLGFVDGNILTPFLQNGNGLKGFTCIFCELLSYTYAGERPGMFPFFLTQKTPPKRKKYFINLNRRPKIHRQIITSELFNNHDDKSIWSFLYPFIGDTPNCSAELQSRINYTSEFKELLPKLLDCDHNANDLSVNSLQSQAHINLVSETIWRNNNSIFITEKTFKAIKYGQPFIILGSPYSLKTLKRYGYKTFSPFINEEYDEIADTDKRTVCVIDEIRRLSALSEDDMCELVYKLNDICLHNWKLFSRNGKTGTVTNTLFKELKEWHPD